MTQTNQDLEDEWANDIENMSMVSETSIHSDLDFQNLINFRKQAQQQSLIKRKTENSKILGLWKNLEQNNQQAIEDFQGELPQLKRIIKNQVNNVIEESKIEEIRENLVLEVEFRAEEEEEQSQLQAVEQENKEIAIHKHSVQQQQRLNEEEKAINSRMEKMFEEREAIGMQMEDKRSMLYQIEFHQNLFKQRFVTPQLKTIKQKCPSISFDLPSIPYTYTNLCPQMNNQSNTFSKHSPIIALQSLDKLTKACAKPLKSVTNQISLSLKPKIQNLIKNYKFQDTFVFDKTQNLSATTLSHFDNFSKNIPKLESITSKYQPKFVNDHLDQQERGQNFSLQESDSHQGKSLKGFLQIISNYDRMKQLKITFQGLSDIKYIETLKNLEYVCLKHNKLISVQQIINNQNIIQLNLSHNKINSMEGIQYLKTLRHLYMDNNQIQNILQLGCPYLEIFTINNNRIRRIEGLNKTTNIRRLQISNNKLQDLKGVSNLYFLNHLRAQHNKLQQIKGLQNCLLLKTLILNNNSIKFISPLAYMFLNKLLLSNNLLTSLPEMFLPSLQQLYIDYNKLKQCSSNLFIPRLKKINLDHNKFQSFSPIWNLLKNSSNCQIIKYDNNQQLSFLNSAINEMYQYMIYKKMGKLEILNQNPYNIGTKRYFESQYQNILKSQQSSNSHNSIMMNQLSSKISSIINQNQFIQSIQTSKHQFRKDNNFIQNKSINIIQNLKKIFYFVSGKQSIFVEINSVYHKYDMYELKKKAALEKIRGIVIREKYRKQKKRKYYMSNKDRIIRLFEQITEDAKIYKIKNVINRFSSVFGENNKNQSMDKIKSCYKRYKNRVKFRKLIQDLKDNKKNKIKFQQEDEFEEIDLNFLDKNYDYSTKMKVPSYMNFQKLIYKNQVFDKAQQIVQNAMLYQQSDTSSRIGSMQNTSSSNGHSINSLKNLNVRFKGNSKKKSLAPINFRQETEKVIQAMRLEGQVTDKVRQQIEQGIRQKHRRKAQNQKEQKYAYQKMQKGNGSKRR